MVTKETSQISQNVSKGLKDAVEKELIKKAKLGQYAIVQKDGKTVRILASALINDTKN